MEINDEYLYSKEVYKKDKININKYNDEIFNMLSDDILLEICQYLCAKDFDNFTNSSKLIHLRCMNDIRLKKLYTNKILDGSLLFNNKFIKTLDYNFNNNDFANFHKIQDD